MRVALLSACLLLACAPCASAATSNATSKASAKPQSMQELLDASKPSDWRTLDPANTL
jgi:peptidylprolyl isomerase